MRKLRDQDNVQEFNAETVLNEIYDKNYHVLMET